MQFGPAVEKSIAAFEADLASRPKRQITADEKRFWERWRRATRIEASARCSTSEFGTWQARAGFQNDY